jgi:hypothetical protein
MSNLVEASRNKFATGNEANGEATCAMDQVYKRIALAEIKGKSISHQGMIDEAFVYIVGAYTLNQGWFHHPDRAVREQVVTKQRKTQQDGA